MRCQLWGPGTCAALHPTRSQLKQPVKSPTHQSVGTRASLCVGGCFERLLLHSNGSFHRKLAGYHYSYVFGRRLFLVSVQLANTSKSLLVGATPCAWRYDPCVVNCCEHLVPVSPLLEATCPCRFVCTRQRQLPHIRTRLQKWSAVVHGGLDEATLATTDRCSRACSFFAGAV